MSTRWEVEQAVLGSKLEPTARLIVLTLLVKADNETAIVPPKYSPSLSALCDATGLAKSALARQLDSLEILGWVKRARPPKNSRSERTNYALTIGADPELKPARNCGRSGPRRGSQSAPSSPSKGPLSSPSQGPLAAPSSPSEGQPVVLPKDRWPGGSGPSEGHASSKELPTKNSLTTAGRQRPAQTSTDEQDPLFEAPIPAPPPAPPKPPREETPGQRRYRIAATYKAKIKLCNMNAIAKIVQLALDAEFSEEQIIAGLEQLADEGRSVTADSLRYAINGPKTSGSTLRHRSPKPADGAPRQPRFQVVETPRDL